MRVVICGGGIIGTACAYYLAKRNIPCLIVEQEEIACAASGNAGGFLARNWCKGTPVDDLSKLSYELHMELSKKFIDADYRCVNAYSTMDDNSTENIRKKEAKLPLWVDDLTTKVYLRDTCENVAQVHPKKLCQRLLHEAQSITNYETKVIFDKVVGIEFENSGSLRTVKSVKLESGSLIGVDIIVIAMGPWSSNAVKWFPRGCVPEVQSERVHSAVFEIPKNVIITADCLFLKNGDSKEPSSTEIYPRPDGTVYLCGEADSKELPEKASAVEIEEKHCEKLQEIMSKTCGSLVAAKRLRDQACYLPNSPDNSPIIGRIKDVKGAFIATGHGCWGILNCTGTGLVISELIATGKCDTIDLDPFRPERFH